MPVKGPVLLEQYTPRVLGFFSSLLHREILYIEINCIVLTITLPDSKVVDDDLSESEEEEDENLPTSKSLLQNELERIAKILFPYNNHCTVHVFTLVKLNISQSCEQILKKITILVPCHI